MKVTLLKILGFLRLFKDGFIRSSRESQIEATELYNELAELIDNLDD
jgi:hypothetical protein